MIRTYEMGLVALGVLLLVGCDEGKQPDKDSAKGSVTNLPKTPEEVKEAVAKAKQTAASASAAILAASGSPSCTQAFVELEQMIKVAESIPGARTSAKVPDKAVFLKICGEAPPAVQKCVVMSYAMQHAAECKAAEEKMDPALKKKLKAMMKDAMAKGK